jgi:hypothetical protein
MMAVIRSRGGSGGMVGQRRGRGFSSDSHPVRFAGPTWGPSLFAGPSRAGLETVPVLADRTLPAPYPPYKMICPAAQRPPGSSSQWTPSWRKADSNRWSHFDRDAFQNTILGPGAAHRFKDRSASARGETDGSNPLSSSEEMVWGRRRGDGTIVAATN